MTEQKLMKGDKILFTFYANPDIYPTFVEDDVNLCIGDDYMVVTYDNEIAAIFKHNVDIHITNGYELH